MVSNAVRAVTSELDLLPDDLYIKSRTFHIELDKIRKAIKKEFNQTASKFNRKVRKKTKKKNYKIKLNCNDLYVLLRRVLPRNKEFAEIDARFKKYLALICISHDVFTHLLEYLDRLIKDYVKFDSMNKKYYIHYVKIQKTLSALEDLCYEHENLIRHIEGLNGESLPWFVSLPYPFDLIEMIAEALIELKNGYLFIPMLRSYVETNFSIVLENTLNNLIDTSGIKEFEGKKLLFQRPMEFGDLMSLLKKFNVMHVNDTDILSRMQDYTSQSIHLGRFFDKFVGWYLLFYLKNIRLINATARTLFADFVKDYENKGKVKVVQKDDKISDYSRFQPESNQIR